ncbi:MAG: hypothetical protein RL026_2850 [Pseudomonadota bacterium]|jgi:hypothetical protein
MTGLLLCSLLVAVPEAVADELEELVVTGRLARLAAAREAIVQAEDRLHARYNEINTHEPFAIECRQEAPTGRIIRTRICEPRYVGEATHQDSDQITGNQADTNVMVQTAEAAFLRRKVEFQRHMAELVRKDPELLRLLQEHGRKVQAYQALSRETFPRRGGQAP